jgi:hypothetical protein
VVRVGVDAVFDDTGIDAPVGDGDERQQKVWGHGPGAEPWEVYVVKAGAATLGKSAGRQNAEDGTRQQSCGIPDTVDGEPAGAGESACF